MQSENDSPHFYNNKSFTKGLCIVVHVATNNVSFETKGLETMLCLGVLGSHNGTGERFQPPLVACTGVLIVPWLFGTNSGCAIGIAPLRLPC